MLCFFSDLEQSKSFVVQFFLEYAFGLWVKK
jgi:hypothetical protein